MSIRYDAGGLGCVTEDSLRKRLLPDMVRGYLASPPSSPAAPAASPSAAAGGGAGIPPPTDAAAADDAAVAAFCARVWRCAPLVAALNVFSNILHAFAEGQLEGALVPTVPCKSRCIVLCIPPFNKNNYTF